MLLELGVAVYSIHNANVQLIKLELLAIVVEGGCRSQHTQKVGISQPWFVSCEGLLLHITHGNLQLSLVW